MATSVNQRVGALVNRPYILAQSAVPVCLAPNGTVATNGIVTLGTALPTTYSGGIWLRLPANAIVGGAAGLYWAVMTSTTQGQVYTNFADPATEFIPFIPSGTLVAAVGSNAAYTQTTGADITLVNVSLPAGSLGLTGCARGTITWQTPNTAGAKTVAVKLATSTISSRTAGSQTGGRGAWLFSNRGIAASQISLSSALQSPYSDGANGLSTTVNTAVAQFVPLTAQIATATDFVIFDSESCEVLP